MKPAEAWEKYRGKSTKPPIGANVLAIDIKGRTVFGMLMPNGKVTDTGGHEFEIKWAADAQCVIDLITDIGLEMEKTRTVKKEQS